jgi:hypothetical protein
MTYEQAEAKALAASKAGHKIKMWYAANQWHWTWLINLGGILVTQDGSTNAAPKGVALIFALEQI